MARNARVVLNRAKLTEVTRAVADGIGAVGAAIVETAHPPDAAPFGVGLVTTGDWGVWAFGRKVAGTARKPRGLRVKRYAIVGVVGWGFPGRFQEFGTVHHGPQPFAHPAVNAVMPKAAGIIESVVRPIVSRL